jgi:hypothetical protein
MRVAQVRGVTFKQESGVWTPVKIEKAFDALVDVATALGYPNASAYNDACVEDPATVENRLKALK